MKKVNIKSDDTPNSENLDSSQKNAPESNISVEDILQEKANIGYEQFPLEIFPDWVKNYADAVSKALPCPPDFMGTFLMGTFSAIINNTRKIKLKNSWKESALLYIALVSEPSTLKSPAMDKALLPIYELQKSAKEKYESDLKDYNPESNEPEPVLEKVYIGDVTIEAAAKVLDNQDRGFLYVKDELTSWIRELNQYKGGKGSDKEFWLSNWSNKPITVTRMKKEIYVESSYIPIMGAFQPDLITKFNSVEKDGFINRILMSCPGKIKNYWSEDDVDEDIQKIFLDKAISLHDEVKNPFGDNFENLTTLSLSSEAKTIWVKWYNELVDLAANEPNKLIEYSLDKMKGYTARFALILQLVHNSKSQKVSKETMEYAIRLAKYFIKHCRITFSLLCENKEVKARLEVINKLEELGKSEEITPRLIYRKLAAYGYKKRADALKLLRELEESGFGEISYKSPKGGGKKYTVFTFFDD